MKTHKKSGFTLVEMLVVICIVGILVALLALAVRSIRIHTATMKANEVSREAAEIPAFKEIQYHPEIFPEESRWTPLLADEDGRVPVLIKNEKGEIVIKMFKVVPKGEQIALKGELRPYTKELADIFGQKVSAEAEAEK